MIKKDCPSESVGKTSALGLPMGVFRLRTRWGGATAGENAGGPDTAGRTPPWARRVVRRPQPWPDRRRAAAADSASLPQAWAAGPPCSADRLFCHPYDRSRDQHLMIPAAVLIRRRSRIGPHFVVPAADAVRLGPADDVAEVTAAQVRRVVEDLIAAAVARGRRGHPRRLRRRLRVLHRIRSL